MKIHTEEMIKDPWWVGKTITCKCGFHATLEKVDAFECVRLTVREDSLTYYCVCGEHLYMNQG